MVQNHEIQPRNTSFRSDSLIIPATLILKSYSRTAMLLQVEVNHRSLKQTNNSGEGLFKKRLRKKK